MRSGLSCTSITNGQRYRWPTDKMAQGMGVDAMDEDKFSGEFRQMIHI
jgi:hypothetical protein